MLIKQSNSSLCVKPCFLTLNCLNNTDCLSCFCPVDFKCPDTKNCSANCGIKIGIINGKICQTYRC